MASLIYKDINILAEFCGPRDISDLTQAEIHNFLGKSQADVMVLFGGSILAGGDVFAKAIQNKVAKTYIIVGGTGHTTQTLRDKMHLQFPDIGSLDCPEALLFNEYIQKQYGLSADYLEVKSTNCGNNIRYLLDLIEGNNIQCSSMILCQDATMQKRMEATLRKYSPEMKIINYASYKAVLKEDFTFSETIWGMWDFERYLSLLMGEIPRLTDDVNGYGPSGKNYLAHVDIPIEVHDAFLRLKQHYKDSVREANPSFAG